MEISQRKSLCQPPGLESEDRSLVCKLNKAIYGLKQACLERLKIASSRLHFVACKCDPSLFIYSKTGSTVYVLVYVYNIIITVNNTPLIQTFTQEFLSRNCMNFGLFSQN